MSKNQESFSNNEIKLYSISPLLASQPSVHYLWVKTNVSSKYEQTAPVKVDLLVDTGASYTTLPVQVLEDLGYDTQNPDNWHPGIVTGKGKTPRIPIVKVSSFYCLKQKIIDFPVLS
jgi:Aspartyl protease